MQKKLKALRLVLGLLQVVGTVKTKASHFSTGPTTSSRHSKKLRPVRLVLGLLQVVGTVKNLKLQTVPPQIC